MRRLVENTGDRWMIAINLFALGMGELLFDDYEEAEKIAERNLALYEEIGDRFGSTMPLIVLGHVELARKELEKARQFYLRCFRTSQEINFYYGMQTSSKYLANVCSALGQYTEAEKYLHHSLVIANEIGFTRDIVHLLYEYARIIAARGELEESAKAQKKLAKWMLPCFGFIVVLLVWQFNSFRRAAIILITIPLIFIGVVIGLLVMNASFGFMVSPFFVSYCLCNPEPTPSDVG